MGFYPYGTWCQGSAVMCHLNRNQAYKQVKTSLRLCRNVRTCGYGNSRRWHKRKETTVETNSAKVSQFSSNGALVDVLSLKLWLWGKAADATEAKHSWDSLLLNQSLEGSRSVLTLWVWARPTCVNDRFTSHSRHSSEQRFLRNRHEPSDFAVSNTFRWGNTCKPGGQHHMLGAARTLHETLDVTRLSPASQRPKKILATARYIFLRWEHWKYNQPSWSPRTLKISWQDHSDKVNNLFRSLNFWCTETSVSSGNERMWQGSEVLFSLLQKQSVVC